MQLKMWLVSEDDLTQEHLESYLLYDSSAPSSGSWTADLVVGKLLTTRVHSMY